MSVQLQQVLQCLLMLAGSSGDTTAHWQLKRASCNFCQPAACSCRTFNVTEQLHPVIRHLLPVIVSIVLFKITLVVV